MISPLLIGVLLLSDQSTFALDKVSFAKKADSELTQAGWKP
jgi:hypothetical protein